MTAKDRITEFRKSHLDIGINAFEEMCGFSSNSLKAKNPGWDKLEAIGNKFPELNMNWVIYGSGSMLLPEEKENLSKNNSNLTKQSKETKRNNSIDNLITKKIEDAVMEHLNETIDTIMRRMNESSQNQGETIKGIIKDQNESNGKNFSILINAIREIVKDEDREKFEGKIVELKRNIG